jgi:ribA/ribD-fused uncharacterized protein
MEFMRVKKFLFASSGSTIILPAQIVTKSGGDFDIDKLTVYMPKLGRNGEVIQSSASLAEYRKNHNDIQDLRYMLNMLLDQSSLLESKAKSKDVPWKVRRKFYELRKELAFIKNKGKSTYVPKTSPDIPFLSVEDFIKFADPLIDKLESLESFEYSAANNLIQVMVDVLSRPEMYDALITPNDSPKLKAMAKSVESKKKKIRASDVFSPTTSYEIFRQNILAKDALGIDAKINTMQTEFQKAGLQISSQDPLKYQYFFPSHRKGTTIPLGMTFFANSVDSRIADILNEFVNGHVDVANEDWIILLGMTNTVTPFAHTMLVQGTSEDLVMKFLGLREVLKAIAKTQESLVFRTPKKSLKLQFYEYAVGLKNSYLAKKEADVLSKEEEALLELLNLISLDSETIFARQLTEELSARYADVLTEMLSTPENIASIFTEKNPLKILLAHMQLAVIETQQKGIQTLISTVDWNTANYESFSEFIMYQDTMRNLMTTFNQSALEYMTNSRGKSSLAKFNVMRYIQDIFKSAFPVLGNDTFLRSLRTTMDIFRVNSVDQKSFISDMKTNFLHVYNAVFKSDSVRGNHSKYFFDGTSGLFNVKNPNNVKEAFARFTQKYPLLYQSNFIAKNMSFLESEETKLLQPQMPNLDTSDPTEERKRRESLQELLNHPDAEVRNLFEDIVLGSYYSNLNRFKPSHIHNIAPVEFTNIQSSINKVNSLLSSPGFEYSSYAKLVGLITKIGENPYQLLGKYNSEVGMNLGISSVLGNLMFTKSARDYARNAKRLLKDGKISSIDAQLNLSGVYELEGKTASFTFTPKVYSFGVSEVQEAPVPKPTAPPSAPTQAPVGEINIYAFPTKKNGFEPLSNFNNGPIRTTINGKEFTFPTVEHLYQVKKALFAGDNTAATKIFKSPTGYQAKKLGSAKEGIINWVQNSPEAWDKVSSEELEAAMRLAFSQNPKAQELLLKTGNAVLTHKAPSASLGKWEKVFPEILTKIRTELQEETQKKKEESDPKPTSQFQGYKNKYPDGTPFSIAGKGTPQGDGKDKAMRQDADGAIVEFKTDKVESSSFTSLNHFNGTYSYEKDRYVGEAFIGDSFVGHSNKIIMLARNGKLSGTPLNEETKRSIKRAFDRGNEFVVGDMPGVDSQFIDYLQEIGAKFTIYHTGESSRIQVPIPAPAAPKAEPETKNVKTLHAWEVQSVHTQKTLVSELTKASLEERSKIIDSYLTRDDNRHAAFFNSPVTYSFADVLSGYVLGQYYEVANSVKDSGTANVGQLLVASHVLNIQANTAETSEELERNKKLAEELKADATLILGVSLTDSQMSQLVDLMYPEEPGDPNPEVKDCGGIKI